jgi:hypothetical protein
VTLLSRLILLPAIALFGQAAGAIDDAASALRSDPVYVEAGADGVLTAGEVDKLRDEISAGDRAIYIAILTDRTVDDAGGARAAWSALSNAVGLGGTYAVVTDSTFLANSTNVANAGELATAAINSRRSEGRYAVLSDFVERVQNADASGGGGAGDAIGDTSTSDDGGSLMPVLVVGGAVVGGAFLWSQSRKTRRLRAEEMQALQGAQQDLLAELSVLADDVLRLEPEITVHPAARPDYEAALSRFKWLEAAIPQIDSPDDPPRIQRAMTEARYAMARAQAIVRGQEPPPPPDDLTHQGRYGEPAVEIDERDEYRRPVYAGYGDGFYGGGFFGGNDLFTGLLLGQMIGGMGGWGWGGDGHGADVGASDGGSFGGADFGGGGGGDFGGGDW